MRFGFVTCVQLGLACMDEIYSVGGKLDLVMTLHDHMAAAKSGRVYVDDFCSKHAIELFKLRNVNDADAVRAVRDSEIDWLFIIGWSQIARSEMLAAPKRGCLGMHPTLLPVGRGRAAIPWAIIKALPETGVTMFKLTEGVDEGPVAAQEVLPLSETETAATLYQRVDDAHRSLMRQAWPDLVADRLVLREQDEARATIWPGRTPADGEINHSMDTATVDRLVRGTTRPYPGAFIDHGACRFRLWAGAVHSVASASGGGALREESGRLWIDLSDGCFEATDWEREAAEA